MLISNEEYNEYIELKKISSSLKDKYEYFNKLEKNGISVEVVTEKSDGGKYNITVTSDSLSDGILRRLAKIIEVRLHKERDNILKAIEDDISSAICFIEEEKMLKRESKYLDTYTYHEFNNDLNQQYLRLNKQVRGIYSSIKSKTEEMEDKFKKRKDNLVRETNILFSKKEKIKQKFETENNELSARLSLTNATLALKQRQLNDLKISIKNTKNKLKFWNRIIK